MADSINNKAKEYYDNDDTGGSLNNNLKDFLKQQGAEGNSLNTLWRNYAYGEGGNSLNTRLGKLWGTSGSLISRWKDVLGLTWDDLKLFFNARRNDPELLLSGATSFDGNDYINTGTTFQSTFRDSFSISAWVKFDDGNPSATTGILGNRNSSGQDAIVWSIDTSGKLQFQYKSNNASKYATSNSAVFANGATEWTHCLVSADNSASQITLYVNGVAVALNSSNNGDISSITMADFTIVDNLYLGARNENGTANTFLDGSLANVGIWNRSLSLSEIESIYWKGQYADLKGTELTNLVSWYNLSADANDSTGTNNGTNNGATTLTDAYSASSPFLPRIQDKATPKGAVALASGSTSFDGSDDYIQLASDGRTDFANQSFTISAWVKFDDVSTHRTIYSYDYTAHSAPHYANHFRLDSDATMTFAWNNGSSAQSIATTATYSANIWYHMAVTFTSGSQKIYVDGSVVASGTATDTITYYDQEVWIGKNNFGGYMDGSIANVAIYSDAKTQSEIQDIMFSSYSTLTSALKTNLVSWYDLGSTGYGNDIVPTSFAGGNQSLVDGVLTVNSSATYGANTQVTQNLKYRLTYTIATIDSGSVNVSFSTGTNQGTDRTTTGTYTEELTVTGNNTWYFKYSSFTGTITNIVLNEVISPDSQGDNEGSIYGATTNTGYTSSPSGVADPLNYGEVYGGNAVSFDGASDYIDTGSSFQSTFRNSFSVSMWVKPDDGQPSAESSFFGTRNSGNEDWIHGNLQTDGDIAFYYKSNGTASEGRTSSAVFPNGSTSWTHIILIADNSANQLKIFSNGNQLSISGGDLSSITMGDWTSSDELFIGARDNNGTAEKFFDGSINNVKIFNTILTQDQVRELYTKPELTLPTGIASSALKLDMPMQEGSGVAILDGSGNQNHGTGSGITWANGQEHGFQHPLVRSNNPMVFDGSDDFVATGTTFNHVNHTISAWVNANITTSSDRIIFDARDSGSDGILLYLRGDNNKIGYQLNSTALTTSLAYDAQDIHVVASYDGSTQKTYINGSLVASQSTSLTISTTTNAVIGARNFSSQASFFGGRINEVAVWDSALTDNEVTALYNSGLPLLPTTDSGNYASADDLVGYWRNNGVTTWLDKANTGVASFDGTNDYIDSGNAFQTTLRSNFSWSTWVNVTDGDEGNYQVLFGARNADESDWIQTDLYNGTIRFVYKANGNTIVSTSSAVLSNGQTGWKHLAFTADGSNMVTYLNGSAIKTTSMSGVTMSEYTSADEIWIGARDMNNTAQLFYDGLMSGTNIFNTALSATEVSELYAIDKRSSISGFSQFSNCVGSWLMGAGTGDTTSTIQDQTSNNNDATVSGANLIGYNDGTVSGSPASIIVPEGLNEGKDSQGYYLTDTDSISSGIRFKGAEYISVQDSETLDYTGSFTIGYWVKPSSLANNDRMITKGTTGTGEWMISIGDNSNIRVYAKDNNDNAKDFTSANALVIGSWSYVTVVINKSNNSVDVYKDGGNLSQGTSAGWNASFSTSVNLRIGVNSSGSGFFNGSIDEVKIYDKALSATEILKNYNNGKSAH